VIAVQPSDRIFTLLSPSLTQGSIVNTIPGVITPKMVTSINAPGFNGHQIDGVARVPKV